jgi:hypothetical protein
MADVFTTHWKDEPIVLGVTPEPWRAAPAKSLAPKAVPAGDPAVIEPFVNDERNSRLAVSLGQRYESHLLWRAPFPQSLLLAGLLTYGDRVLVYGTSWRLLSADGQPVQGGAMGTSEMLIDPPRGLFFAADQFGLIAARRLSDGAQSFAVSLYGGKSFQRTYLARRQRLLISTGFKLALDAHAPPPLLSTLIVADLGDPAKQKSWDEEGGPVVTGDLESATQRFLVAMHGDSIYLATDDRVYIVDLELKFKHAIAGTFLPMAMSIDETGQIYLMVHAEGKTSLWSLSAAGERAYAFELPPGSSPALPPIVGYDHAVYLVAGSFIYCVGQDGKLNWSRQAAGRVTGAAVTADGELLTNEGSQIAAWNSKGERHLLHSFAGESLAAAPILAANGDLLAVTQANVYRFLLKTKPD